MLKYVKLVYKELKNGENLDLYITITLSIVVAILSIIGATEFKILSAAILAVLGLLANSLLSSRRAMSDMQSAANELETEIKSLKSNIFASDSSSTFTFQKDFPDFSKDFQSAKRISVLGASLHSTTIRYYSDYEKALQRGASLRILVCEPSSTLLEIQVFRTYAIRDVKLLKRSIKDHISLMQKLQSSLPNSKCESKTISLIISSGLVIVENDDGTAKIFVKLMPFRTPGSDYPVFELNNKKNQEWFDFFYNQFEMLWGASKDAK